MGVAGSLGGMCGRRGGRSLKGAGSRDLRQ